MTQALKVVVMLAGTGRKRRRERPIGRMAPDRRMMRLLLRD
jgi:hypothetical protein